MATVYIIACLQSPNTVTNNYGQSCPQSARIRLAVDDSVIQGTTLEVTTKPEPVNPERVQDQYLLFLAFLAVIVVVWGLKQLLNLFSGDTSKD